MRSIRCLNPPEHNALSLSAIVLQKSFVDFHVDFAQPLLGAVRPIAAGSDLILQLGDAIFRGSQLIRKLLSRSYRAPGVLLCNVRGPVQQSQNRLTRTFDSRCLCVSAKTGPRAQIRLAFSHPPQRSYLRMDG
jgi:hypothetical protein